MAVLSEVHDYILTLIEEKLGPGYKLPGARCIAGLFDCSLPRVQTVLDSLEQSGVVESRPRSGTYVRADYKERILPRNVSCTYLLSTLLKAQLKNFKKQFPDLHLTSNFSAGGVEILSSFVILSRQNQYQDLSEIFEETFPDCEKRFFMDALRPFCYNGKLCAVPITFSPQILWYNPEIFKQTGTPLPVNGWSEEDFFATIRHLHKTLSGRRIINYSPGFHQWSNFIHASGGMLFDPKLPEPVQADSPETLKACLKYLDLLRDLDLTVDYDKDAGDSFAAGKLAMFSGFRQSRCLFQNAGINFTPGAVFMPSRGPVKQLGAELIAFRKNFHDKKMIRQLLKFLLSDSIQETFGRNGYGIPFLRSAAEKTLDPSNEPDRSLLENIPPLDASCHIQSEELGKIVRRASLLINASAPEDLPDILKELATTMKFLRKIKH